MLNYTIYFYLLRVWNLNSNVIIFYTNTTCKIYNNKLLFIENNLKSLALTTLVLILFSGSFIYCFVE